MVGNGNLEILRFLEFEKFQGDILGLFLFSFHLLSINNVVLTY